MSMATKLLLLQDVYNLGRKGDLVSAKAGFAYNYLIPQGFGVIATAAAMRRQTKLQEERRRQAENERKEAMEVAEKLNGATLTFTVKVDAEGHLYGSVSTHDIQELIQRELNIELDKRAIGLKHAIKETGVFDLSLKLKEGVVAEIHVKVIPEQAQ